MIRPFDQLYTMRIEFNQDAHERRINQYLSEIIRDMTNLLIDANVKRITVEPTE